MASSEVRSLIESAENIGFWLVYSMFAITLIEDFFTGGVGVADDIPSIFFALPIIKPAFGF